MYQCEVKIELYFVSVAHQEMSYFNMHCCVTATKVQVINRYMDGQPDKFRTQCES